MIENADQSEPWYSVKLIFAWYVDNPFVPSRYEERIVILRAADFDDAIKQAEDEAAEYCRRPGWKVEYVGFADAYHLFEKDLGHGVEVFSTLRASALEPDEYLERFYPDEDDDLPEKQR